MRDHHECDSPDLQLSIRPWSSHTHTHTHKHTHTHTHMSVGSWQGFTVYWYSDHVFTYAFETFRWGTLKNDDVISKFTAHTLRSLPYHREVTTDLFCTERSVTTNQRACFHFKPYIHVEQQAGISLFMKFVTCFCPYNRYILPESCTAQT